MSDKILETSEFASDVKLLSLEGPRMLESSAFLELVWVLGTASGEIGVCHLPTRGSVSAA